MSKHQYLELDPPSHTHSAGEIVGHDGEDLVGPSGRDGVNGVDGRDGLDGKDSTIPGPQGQRGDGKDGADGRDGRDGTDGKDGADAVLPANLVTVDSHSGTLFGVPPADVQYRFVAGMSRLTFRGGYAAFPLPEGTSGIVSFSASLVGVSGIGVGVAKPTDASAIALLANEVVGDAEVTYTALIW